MDKINAFLHTCNRLIRTTGFQLTLFLSIQLVGLALAVASVHYMQTRERQFADMRLRYQGSVLRENVLSQFDVIEARADDIRYKVSAIHPWWQMSPEEAHIYLKSFITKSVPTVRHMLLFDEKGELKIATTDFPVPVVNIKDREYFKKFYFDNLDRMHYGPYVGRITKLMSYAVLRRLTYRDGTFAGALLVAADTAYFGQLCKNTVPNDMYDFFLLNAANEVVVWCSYGKTHEEDYGKAFSDTVIGKGVDLDSQSANDMNRLETETHLFDLNLLPGYSGLKVVSAVDKQSISNASEGMIWQNYLLLMVGMLSQIVCFMMFNNSLRLSRILWSPEKDSLPLDALLKTHQDWRLKFRGAILEKEKVHALAIMDKDGCALGKWLAAKTDQFEHTATFQVLVDKHTVFHMEAGKVANLVNASEYEKALEAIAEGSAYTVASIELTEALFLLKKELAVLV